MKTCKQFLTGAIALWIVCLLSSCEQNITVESVVHPDGIIDRTITFTEVDSSKAYRNIFGVHTGTGWESKVEHVQPSDRAETKTSQQKYNITFHKIFASVDEMNKTLNTPNDTLFRISSSFEKNFRWFYTYIKYTDTYIAANRFKQLPKEHYFTQEDVAFINRMPAEGKSITKADSLYLDLLTEKLGDFFMQALYEEHFNIMLKAMHKNNIPRQWVDSLNHHKGYLFAMLEKKENEPNFEEAFMPELIDSLHIGFPMEKVAGDYKVLYDSIKPCISFMTEVASESKFAHTIKMPWKVVATNADSVNGAALYWQPLTLKFLLNDYTMYAESRKMNYWAVVVSALIIAVTMAVFWKRRRVD